MLAVGVAFSGGEDSPALPWLIMPVAIAALRFRSQVVVLGATITAVVMVGVSEASTLKRLLTTRLA